MNSNNFKKTVVALALISMNTTAFAINCRPADEAQYRAGIEEKIAEVTNVHDKVYAGVKTPADQTGGAFSCLDNLWPVFSGTFSLPGIDEIIKAIMEAIAKKVCQEVRAKQDELLGDLNADFYPGIDFPGLENIGGGFGFGGQGSGPGVAIDGTAFGKDTGFKADGGANSGAAMVQKAISEANKASNSAIDSGKAANQTILEAPTKMTQPAPTNTSPFQ